MSDRRAGRLAIVTSHPIQYQAPWFRALSKEINLHVFFCHRQDAAGQAAAGFGQAFEWDVPLLDGYEYSWLENVSPAPGVETFSGCDTPEIGDRLRAGGFDACLVNGWYLKSYVQAVCACRKLRMPILMRGDSQLVTARSRLWMAVKYWPYRWFLSRIDAHLYVGCANYRYLRHYGVPPTRLFPVRHFVDNDRFAGAASSARADGSVATLRETWGAGAGTTVLLFAGKLIGKKRPLDFVDAIGRAARRGAPVIGVVVGAGPLEDVLRARVGAADAPVRFAGFQNQTALPGYYAAADCLVLPSDGGETWGLVVNEAMACGVPAIVSDAVGCREDLIENDVTGASYGLADVDALTDAVIACASRSCDAVERMRAAVLERIDQYSCEGAVQGALKALQTVATHREWS